MKEPLQEMRGIRVIDCQHGASLGTVSEIIVDAGSARLAGIGLRRSVREPMLYIRFDDIRLIGPDVVLLKADRPATEMLLESEHRPSGRSLAMLRGEPVATTDGRILGRLSDFEIDTESGEIIELHFSDGSLVPIDPQAITIGPDEIIVPPSAAEAVTAAPEKRGFFARVLDLETPQRLADRVKRWVRREAEVESKGDRPQPPPPH